MARIITQTENITDVAPSPLSHTISESRPSISPEPSQSSLKTKKNSESRVMLLCI